MHFRLWPQYPEDGRREDLLHAVRHGRDPTEPGNVPEHRWTAEHLRDVRLTRDETLPPFRAQDGSLADLAHIHIHADVLGRGGRWGVGVQLLRGLVLPRLVLLLRDHSDHRRVRGLRRLTEEPRPSEPARVRRLQHPLHPVRSGGRLGGHEPPRPSIPHHEHARRTAGRTDGGDQAVDSRGHRRSVADRQWSPHDDVSAVQCSYLSPARFVSRHRRRGCQTSPADLAENRRRLSRTLQNLLPQQQRRRRSRCGG